MRIGQNPAKMGLPAYQPKRLGIAVLSYIPSQEGFFAHSLEILKYQVASIHKSTPDFDLLVFDNGSSPEVQQELRNLQADGLIHFLILSKFNLGKTGALNWILASLPNELIGFADGDVLFRPGWWGETERIFSVFSNVGLVTAQPCLFDILRGTGQAHNLLKNDPRYRCFEEHLSSETVNEYARGIGLAVDQINGLKKNPVGFVEDRSSGLRVVIGASHMQFVIRRETARRLLPLPASYALNRDEDAYLNRSIDQMNLLHLSTITPFVYHMGNRLDETALNEIRHMGLDEILQHAPAMHTTVLSQMQIRPAKRRAIQILNRLARASIFKKMLQRLYNFLFEYYAQVK